MWATTLLQTVLNPVTTQEPVWPHIGASESGRCPHWPPHPLNPASQDGLWGHKRSTFLGESPRTAAHVLILAVRLLRNNNLFCK